MLQLQNKLLEYSLYNVGFNIYDGQMVVHIIYPSSWTIIEPGNPAVTFARDTKNPQLYYYIASVTVNIEEIFNSIENTVNFNKELEEKEQLLKQKVNELQELFVMEPIERLKTLQFVIPDTLPVKTKKSRKLKENGQKKEVNKTEVQEVSNDKQEQSIDDKLEQYISEEGH